jgi:hypothetical protein
LWILFRILIGRWAIKGFFLSEAMGCTGCFFLVGWRLLVDLTSFMDA